MSLPTTARFYDAQNKLIATHHIDCGWWLDAEVFANLVMSLPWVKNTKYVSLYGINIPAKFIERPEFTEWSEYKATIIDNAQKMLPEWNLENADLKEAVRLLYLETKYEETN